MLIDLADGGFDFDPGRALFFSRAPLALFPEIENAKLAVRGL